MTSPAPGSAAAPASAWTCPFCSLHCHDLALEVAMPPGGPGGPDGAGGTTTVALRPLPAQPATTTTAAAPAPCSRASEALARWTAGQPTSADAPPAWIAGQPATLDAGLARAAELLASARQPLIGGLATDVQGTRALMRLAGRIGAISDHLNGEAQALATRLLHDQGAWQVTLGEVVDRAEVMVCIGSDPAARHPRFWQRLRADRDDSPLKQIVMLGLGQATSAAALQTARLATAGRAEPPQIEALDLDAGDLFDQLQALALAFRRRTPAGLPAAWTELAAVLKGSTYTCFVWEPGVWPRHGELVAQALQGVIATLNHSATRAGSFMLGGGEGGATALQVHAWLTGLPLRTRLDRRPGGAIDHDPLLHGTARLLGQAGADRLLWISSFGALDLPAGADPAASIVFGPPQPAATLMATPPAVYLGVATPGLAHAGHLFRGDGIVAVPLDAPLAGATPAWPSVAELARRLTDSLPLATEREEVQA